MGTVTSPGSTIPANTGAWATTTNVYVSDNTYATHAGTTQNQEYSFEVGGFNFASLPDVFGDTTVTVEAKTTTANRAQIKVELLDDTTVLATRALANLTASDANYTLVYTATKEQLQSANLKVRVTNKRTVSQASTTSVDFVKIDVAIPNPKLETFTDDFATELDKVVKWPASSAQAVWEAGQAKIPCASAYYGIQQLNTGGYDLTGSYLIAKVTPPEGAANRETFMQIYRAGGTVDALAIFRNQASNLGTRRTNNSTHTFGNSTTYDPVAHAWWRIRESNGTIYFDVGPDGVNWTNLWSTAPGFAVNDIWVNFITGWFTSDDGTGVAYIDNVNTLGAGGQALTFTGTDNAALTDTFGTVLTPEGGALTASKEETTGLTDLVTYAITRAYPDTEALTDLFIRALAKVYPPDAEALTDTWAVSWAAKTFIDNAGLTDSIIASMGGTSAFTDNEPLSDITTTALSATRTFSDNEPLSDITTTALSATRTFSDNEPLTDDKTFAIGRTYIDSQSLTDTFVVSISRAYIDLEILTDELGTGATRLYGDTSALTDSFVVALAKTYTDLAGIADSISYPSAITGRPKVTLDGSSFITKPGKVWLGSSSATVGLTAFGINGPSVKTVSVTIPAGVTVGSMLLLAVTSTTSNIENWNTAVLSGAGGSGWTGVSPPGGTSGINMFLWHKIATAGDLGAVVTLTVGTSAVANGMIACIAEVKGGALNLTNTQYNSSATFGGAGGAASVPQSRWIVLSCGVRSTTDVGTVYTAPSGWTVHSSQNTNAWASAKTYLMVTSKDAEVSGLVNPISSAPGFDDDSGATFNRFSWSIFATGDAATWPEKPWKRWTGTGWKKIGATTEEPATQSLQWGVFRYPETLDQIATMMGRPAKYVTLFADEWDGLHVPTSELNTINAHGAVPIMTLEPWDSTNGTTNQPTFKMSTYPTGNHDTNLNGWADSLKALPYTVIVRWGHEFNGNWYPWCVNNSTGNVNTNAEYKAAFIHVVNLFRGRGATNVKFMWCINQPWDATTRNVSPAYPGDSYVDYLAVDAYNWGNNLVSGTQHYWQEPAEMYQESLDILRGISAKPLVIPETACSETGYPGGRSKALWITDQVAYLKTQSQLVGFVWFHINKELNWRLNSPQTTGTTATASSDAMKTALATLAP